MPEGVRSPEPDLSKVGVGAPEEDAGVAAATGVTGLGTDAALVKYVRCRRSNSTLRARASQCTWVPAALNVMALAHTSRMSFKKAAREPYLSKENNLDFSAGKQRMHVTRVA